MPIQRWYYVRCQYFISAHVRAYAIRPYTCSVEIRASLGENTITNRPIQSSCNHRIYRKCVGAYRIRPSRRRTCPFNDGIMFAANISFPPFTAANMTIQRWYYVRCHHFIFVHVRAYAIRPYDFPVTQKQLYFHIVICAIISLSKMNSQMGNPHLPGIKGTFAIGNQG